MSNGEEVSKENVTSGVVRVGDTRQRTYFETVSRRVGAPTSETTQPSPPGPASERPLASARYSRSRQAVPKGPPATARTQRPSKRIRGPRAESCAASDSPMTWHSWDSRNGGLIIASLDTDMPPAGASGSGRRFTAAAHGLSVVEVEAGSSPPPTPQNKPSRPGPRGEGRSVVECSTFTPGAWPAPRRVGRRQRGGPGGGSVRGRRDPACHRRAISVPVTGVIEGEPGGTADHGMKKPPTHVFAGGGLFDQVVAGPGFEPG